jgi:hypothetical protein
MYARFDFATLISCLRMHMSSSLVSGRCHRHHGLTGPLGVDH